MGWDVKREQGKEGSCSKLLLRNFYHWLTSVQLSWYYLNNCKDSREISRLFILRGAEGVKNYSRYYWRFSYVLNDRVHKLGNFEHFLIARERYKKINEEVEDVSLSARYFVLFFLLRTPSPWFPFKFFSDKVRVFFHPNQDGKPLKIFANLDFHS